MTETFARTPGVVRADRGQVAWLTLNRPEKLNAVSREVLADLNGLLDEIESDDTVRVVVVTAVGRAFCAGADLDDGLGANGVPDPTGVLRFEAHVARTFGRLAALPKPVIAALNGITLAGGLELAMHCDLVLASDSARIGDGHIKYGLLPAAGGAARLSRLIGPTRCKYLAFTGALLTATECQAMGLVHEVLAADRLVPRTQELATQIASRSPSALRLFKQAIDDGLDQPLASALRLERLVTAEHLHSGDVGEGLRAFRGKRPPSFGSLSPKAEERTDDD